MGTSSVLFRRRGMKLMTHRTGSVPIMASALRTIQSDTRRRLPANTPRQPAPLRGLQIGSILKPRISSTVVPI